MRSSIFLFLHVILSFWWGFYSSSEKLMPNLPISRRGGSPATGIRGATPLLFLISSSPSHSCYTNELQFNSSYAEIRLHVQDWSCVLPNKNDMTHATSTNIRWLMIGADEAVITGAKYNTPGLVAWPPSILRHIFDTCLLICPTIRKQKTFDVLALAGWEIIWYFGQLSFGLQYSPEGLLSWVMVSWANFAFIWIVCKMGSNPSQRWFLPTFMIIPSPLKT